MIIGERRILKSRPHLTVYFGDRCTCSVLHMKGKKDIQLECAGLSAPSSCMALDEFAREQVEALAAGATYLFQTQRCEGWLMRSHSCLLPVSKEGRVLWKLFQWMHKKYCTGPLSDCEPETGQLFLLSFHHTIYL